MKRILVLLGLVASLCEAQHIVWTRSFAWRNAFDPDVAVDSRDNVIVAAAPWLRKFSPAGDSLWAKEIILPGEITFDIATDRDDNILIGKAITDSAWVVMKLTSTGESLWTWQVAWPGPDPYRFGDLATNGNGCVLITGYTGNHDMWVTFQLKPDGRTDWTRAFSSNWESDVAAGICGDPSDNVIVGGRRGIWGRPRQRFPQLFKYSKDGESLAAAVYDPYPFPADLDGCRPATDRYGNMILPGRGEIADTVGMRIRWAGAFLLKYDPQGNPLWQWFSDSAHGYLYPTCCATDTVGNIVLAGSSSLPDQRLVVELRQFLPDGETAWRLDCPLRDSYPDPVSFPGVALAVDHHSDFIAAAKNMSGTAPHDSALVFKVTEREGISEGQPSIGSANVACPATVTTRGDLGLTPAYGFRFVAVYGASGTLVRKSRNGQIASGLPSGVYFVRFESPNGRLTRKVVLTR